MKKTITFFAAATVLCCACTDKDGYDACGNFEAEDIILSGQGTGQIIRFDVQEGMQIEQGDCLGLIDTMQLHFQKAQLEAQVKSLGISRQDITGQVASLKTQIENLKSEKARTDKLISMGAAPSKQADDIQAQIDILENQLSAQMTALSRGNSAIEYNAGALEAQIDMLEDKIRKCMIVSPMSGTVTAKYAGAGELASFGTPLMKIADLGTMYLRAYFTSDQLGLIKTGDEVNVTADYGADMQYRYKGKITWISPESEFTPKAIQTRNTRANLVYAVKIAVKNDGRLKIGMYGEVSLQ